MDENTADSAPPPLQYAMPDFGNIKENVRNLRWHIMSGTLVGIVLFALPLLYDGYAERVIPGLSDEMASWGSLLLFIPLWPLAVYCCLSGIYRSLLLLLETTPRWLPVSAIAVSLTLLGLMWHLSH